MARFGIRRGLYAFVPLILPGQRSEALEAGGTERIRQCFIGTWRLVIDEIISKEGKVTYPDVGAT